MKKMKLKKFIIKYWYWILIGAIILFFILRSMEIIPLAISDTLPVPSHFSGGGGGG